MANSYGFNGDIPVDALYGVYDGVNGEWTGKFFYDAESAQAAANSLADDPILGIVPTSDDDAWLEPDD
jgi:hypothetical protein